MVEWMGAFSSWLQTWLSMDAGLWGLFLSALLSATVLPGSSEAFLAALVAAYPTQAWSAFAVGTLGNVLGGAITFGMGAAGGEGYARFQSLRVDSSGPVAHRLQRWGPPMLFWSFLPIVGDALVLAAGWMRLPLGTSLAWLAAGKAARYAAIVLALLGLLPSA